jgi:hypothetical protein
MPNLPTINPLQQLLQGVNLTVEQTVLINYILTKSVNSKNVPTSAVWFHKITGNVLIAGSEFVTYSASKLYICFNLFIYGSFLALPTFNAVSFYDEANANMMTSSDQNAAQNAATTFNYIKPVVMNNLWFSRLTDDTGNYYGLMFNGIKLTY